MYVQSETKHGSVFTCSITRLFRVRPEVARQRSYVTSLVYSDRTVPWTVNAMSSAFGDFIRWLLLTTM